MVTDQPLQLLHTTISMENASVGRDATPRHKQPKETGNNNKKMLLRNPCSEVQMAQLTIQSPYKHLGWKNL